MLGSLSGSLLRAAHASGWPTASSATASPSNRRPGVMRALFPVLDFKLRLLRARVIGDLELEIFRAHALLESQVGAAPVSAIVRALAIEKRNQLVAAGLQIADIQPLHATLDERRHFARRVQIIGHFPVVDLERDRIEREEIPDVHRDE